MSRVFFDSNLFIYLLEDLGSNGKRVRSVLERLRDRRDTLVTSALSLGEVLVRPFLQGDARLEREYENLLGSQHVVVVDFDRAAARIYARLRQDKSLKAPDAIQLACAASAKADLFITNDDRLSRKVVPGVQFIASLQNAPL